MKLINQHDDDAAAANHAEASWAENVEVLNLEFESQKVTIARDICDQPYGAETSTLKTATAIGCALDRTQKDDYRALLSARDGVGCLSE